MISFVAGILYSFSDALVSIRWLTSTNTPGVSYGTVLAFGALIGMPIIFASFGLALGLVEALLYNLFAGMFGGMKLDFEQ